jgi:thiamine-phosphate pyrophosphorylase
MEPAVFDPATLRLIAITDDLRDGIAGLVRRAAAAVDGGATMVQLRLKDVDARTLVEVGRALVAALPVPLVVNDRVDVALACGAAGAHVGTSDLPVSAARSIVPPGFIIGASLSSDPELDNARQGDYVGIGPVFPTTSKSDAVPPIGVEAFARLSRAVGRPAVAIGGVTPENAGVVRQAGAAGVAVIKAVFGSPSPAEAARALASAIGS